MLDAVLVGVCAALGVAAVALWRSKVSIEGQLRAVRDAHDALRDQLTAAEKNEALANQKLEGMELRLKDFELLKTQFEQYAKAAALETGNQLSNKLMADHVRAREETHKQFEQFTKTARDELLLKQQELATTLGAVQGQMNDSKTQLATLVRAMQNPIGAGAEGEIVMGNILQQHGFTQGLDYELQVHLAAEEGSLRPDCVIYLPHQHAIIVDSKASQHIFALFRAEGTPAFDAAFKEIQATMRAHAKALSGKAYQDSLRKLKNRNGEAITRTTLVMFIPNDEVVTRLMQKDPNLMDYLRTHDIVLAGPVTLSGIFLTARALVREAKQVDAHHAIVELTSELMADLITALGYAEDVMKGIRGSATAYDKFAASLNKGVMARLKRLAAKGVRPAKNKQLAGNLPRYSIHREDDVVAGEAEEVVELLQLPKEDAA
ncbi:MAG: DNA recombination protein RmuC [Alphaproteobacteria bacterium]|nr:DNA recombination protein RmuC [Alphaproteobacteria bacterium]